MKMKKLTALALAGVLCLGMSTTAFAAASPLPKDAVTAVNDEDKEVTVTQSPVQTDSGTFKDWNSKNPEKVDKSVRATLDDRLDAIKKELRDESKLTTEYVADLKEEQATIEELVASDEQFVVVSLADIKAPGTVVDEENPLNIKFSLNGDAAWKGIKAGETVRIMHKLSNDQLIITEATVEWNEKDGFFVQQKFDSLSPVAILRFADASNDPGTNPGNNDGTNNDGSNNDTTVNPDNNGNITADQLADLIVKKLQQNANATKVVRVVSSAQASPKTGE